MTVAATPRRAGPFNGNGLATAFPFEFKVFAKQDIAVVVTDDQGSETRAVLDSDYSVFLNADQDSNPGGTVIYPSSVGAASLPFGWRLTMIGALGYEQLIDITNVGRFNPDVLEKGLDKAVILLQQLFEIASRSLQAAVGADNSLTFPAPSAGRFLRWRADGEGLENADTGSDSTVLQGWLMDGEAILRGAGMIGFDSGTLSEYLRTKSARVVNSIAALRALPKTKFAFASVNGYYAAGDGSTGAYFLDPADTTTPENGGSVIVGADGGRWKLIGGNVSAKQFGAGAALPGVTNTAAFSAAAAAAGPYGVVDLPRAVYPISGVPAMPNAAIRGKASDFTGGYPKSIVDGSALGVSNEWIAGEMSRVGTSVGGSANQHLTHLSVFNGPTGSPGPYEKTAQYIRFTQADTSDGTSILRDFVGQQITGAFGPGVMSGRQWGQHLWVDAPAGTEGYLVGSEIEVYNRTGTPSYALDTAATKLGTHYVAVGGVSSAAILLNGRDGGLWHSGIFAHRSALNENLIRIDNEFIVTKDGRIARGTVSPNFETGYTHITATENAITRLEVPAGKSAFHTVVRTGLNAYSAGVQTGSGDYVLSLGETLFGSSLLRASAAGIGFLGAVPTLSIGWAAPTGMRSKAAFAIDTVTTPELAARVAAMYDALQNYGLLAA